MLYIYLPGESAAHGGGGGLHPGYCVHDGGHLVTLSRAPAPASAAEQDQGLPENRVHHHDRRTSVNKLTD